MLGWLLLAISAALYTGHSYLTAGVEAALFTAATLFGLAGLWIKVEEVHEREKITRSRRITYYGDRR